MMHSNIRSIPEFDAPENEMERFAKFRFIRQFGRGLEPRGVTTISFNNFDRLFAGTARGQVKIFNVQTGERLGTYTCDARNVANIDTRKNSSLLITSNGQRIGQSSLWNYGVEHYGLERLKDFPSVKFMEFANSSVSKMIATKRNEAVLIDTETSNEIQSFQSLQKNDYDSNIATTSYDDEYVLSDGVLYDMRSGIMVRQLDKDNSIYNGIFHPNRREIILNSAIYDLRNLSVHQMVPLFERCKIKFNRPVGSIIYSVMPEKTGLAENEMCLFHTLQAHDYNPIGHAQVTSPVFEVTPDFNDRYVATVEFIRPVIGPHAIPMIGVSTVCKLYEIGSLNDELIDQECASGIEETVAPPAILSEHMEVEDYVSSDEDEGGESNEDSEDVTSDEEESDEEEDEQELDEEDLYEPNEADEPPKKKRRTE